MRRSVQAPHEKAGRVSEATRDSSVRCGFVALAGPPNVGKSTLLNALVGEHLSIVSPKAQTTRQRVTGLLSAEGHQILFVDAPGLIEPRYKLQEAMRWAAEAAIDDADVVVFITDATHLDRGPDEAIDRVLAARSVPCLTVLNKSDLVDEARIAYLTGRYRQSGRETLAVSATTGAGLDALIDWIVLRLPESPPLYPPEISAIQPVRFFAEEYVREACMELLEQEVPYGIASRVEEFREDEDPVYIRMTILVERPSQKGIVIGRGGAMIREVGTRARSKIEALLGRRAYLELRVKVLAGWSRKSARLRQLGFHVPSDQRWTDASRGAR